MPDDILIEYIKYFEEGEEILEKCNKNECYSCSGVIPNLVIYEERIYPTYEPCKMYYIKKVIDKLKGFIVEIPTDKNFSNFIIEKNQEGIITLINMYIKKELYLQGKGIFFYGGCGVGKTHLSFAILNHINQNTNLYSFAIYVPEFIQRIRDYYSQGDVEINPVLEIAKIPVLLVDDLGAERYTDWVSEQIVQLLDYRYRNKLSTIITSNLNLKELKEKVGERIYSRVVGLSKPVLVLNEDYRKRQQDW